jgi:hypothetical protein
MNDDQLQPFLVHCPNCKNRRDDVTLGSVTSQGYVIIKRKFNRQMMIMAESYSIICDCGYFIRITDGKVTASALSGTFING